MHSDLGQEHALQACMRSAPATSNVHVMCAGFAATKLSGSCRDGEVNSRWDWRLPSESVAPPIQPWTHLVAHIINTRMLLYKTTHAQQHSHCVPARAVCGAP
jgi:hypothetical protein